MGCIDDSVFVFSWDAASFLACFSSSGTSDAPDSKNVINFCWTYNFCIIRRCFSRVLLLGLRDREHMSALTLKREPIEEFVDSFFAYLSWRCEFLSFRFALWKMWRESFHKQLNEAGKNYAEKSRRWRSGRELVANVRQWLHFRIAH